MNQDGTRSGELPDYQKGDYHTQSLANENVTVLVSSLVVPSGTWIETSRGLKLTKSKKVMPVGMWIETMFAQTIQNVHNPNVAILCNTSGKSPDH